MNRETTAKDAKDIRVKYFVWLAAKERGVYATPQFAEILRVEFDGLLTRLLEDRQAIPAKDLDDAALAASHANVMRAIEDFHAQPGDNEHGGSPGEGLYELLDELETEIKRRKAARI